ncbi:MAG: CPBP family intramembrane metalloprotease [Chitinophagaceae bacterium]|nr:MAG: CPBP family intramembrane metalloprotease [Chitinophagaceae bacterium]
MTGHLRIKSPNTQLGVLLLVYFVTQILILSLAQLILGDITNLSNPANIPKVKAFQAASSILLFFLPAFLFATFTFRGRYLHYLGFNPAERAPMYAIGSICMLVAFPLVFWLGAINQLIPLPESMIKLEENAGKQMEIFLKVNSGWDIVINVIIIGLLPAICEEVFFRGAMQRIMIQLTKNPWLGIVLTAALFSAFHLQFQGFLPRLFLGIILGALYWFSGSIWTSILAHFITNTAQVLAASYATEYVHHNPTVPIYLAIASGIAVFGLMRLYLRFSTITWSKVYERDGLTKYNDFMV